MKKRNYKDRKWRHKKITKFWEERLIDLKTNGVFLHLRKTYTNIFITITDKQGETLAWQSSGTAMREIKSKRLKRSVNALEPIMSKLYPVLSLIKIEEVTLILSTKIRSYVYRLFKELAYYNIRVKAIRDRRKFKYTTMRGRKRRRV